MKKSITLGLICMLTMGVMTSPTQANSRIENPNAAPSPGEYTVHEVTIEGARLWDGQSWVTGWEKFRIAIPKEVQCDYPKWAMNSGNCTAFIRSSAENSVGNLSQPDTRKSFNLVFWPQGQLADRLDFLFVPNHTITPAMERGQPAGTSWSETKVEFSWLESETVLAFFERERLSRSSTQLASFKVSVKTRAEVEAEEAAEEAARQAELARQARIEAARVSKILAKKFTITCRAGTKVRRVTGDPPICPRGFSNPLSSQPAFQAYSKCRLYKKTQGVATAKLQDAGKTLRIGRYGLGDSKIDLNRSDWACVTKSLKVPASVLNKIGQTRAIDGIVNAKFGQLNAFWTYHPDDGLDITFSR